MKTVKTTLSISAILFLLATAAFAHGGCGRHKGMQGGQGMGYGDCGNCGGCMRGCVYGPGAGLTEEQGAKIDAARKAFYQETRDLRGKIEEKSVALRNALNQDEPDAGKVADLQKELSALQARFDQKRVTHRLEMRKLLPEDFRGRGFGRGAGMGPGYCW
ncbi:MAG: periplasmic heavy metal sensor [Desulfatitalea sp.]|nr:periplasmic heavy metal sensor [Desulfatitalea sp.]NNK01738.1 periplasmic heavy metal sensor [Desulfatitalea sp.]